MQELDIPTLPSHADLMRGVNEAKGSKEGKRSVKVPDNTEEEEAAVRRLMADTLKGLPAGLSDTCGPLMLSLVCRSGGGGPPAAGAGRGRGAGV